MALTTFGISPTPCYRSNRPHLYRLIGQKLMIMTFNVEPTLFPLDEPAYDPGIIVDEAGFLEKC
jgi:hypothetical protein